MRVLILAAAAVPSSTAAIITPNVTTEYGAIRGNPHDANGILSFLGIPYARPPVGNYRWRSPSSHPQWSVPIETQQIGPSCWNFMPGIIRGNQSEDCLTMNIWTSANTTTDKLPVMVWIYGGGFMFGGTSQPVYNGSSLAQKGVVLVTFGYRLGNFGFLALPELDKEKHNSGNFGLQDQQFALAWVKKNIASFGGDPSNVLIFGESAGAHSVGLLMSSPLTKRLAHKAIMESGAWWDSNHGSLETFDAARQRGIAWALKFNSTNPTELRKLSAQQVLASAPYNLLTSGDPSVSNFSPNIDDYVLKAAPGRTFLESKQLQIPVLAGWNQHEEALFTPWALPHNTPAEFQEYLPLQFFNRTSKALHNPQLYPANNASQTNNSAVDLIGDLIIRQQTWKVVESQAEKVSRVFAYYYTYTSAYSPEAVHTAELPFVFGTTNTKNPAALQFTTGDEVDVAFSDIIMTYWTNFAKQSDPNGPGLPPWPEYTTPKSANIMQLGNVLGAIDYDLSRFKFIDTFRTKGVLPEAWKAINVTEIMS